MQENQIDPAFREFIQQRNREPEQAKENPDLPKDGINPEFAKYIKERNQQFTNDKNLDNGKNNHQ